MTKEHSIAGRVDGGILRLRAAVSARQFGEVAITWDQCNSERVLRAWVDHAAARRERIDLDYIGIDPRAIAVLPREVAAYYCALAVRLLPDMLIVAVADAGGIPPLRAYLSGIRPELRFILADHHTVADLVAAYYDAPDAAMA